MTYSTQTMMTSSQWAQQTMMTSSQWSQWWRHHNEYNDDVMTNSTQTMMTSSQSSHQTMITQSIQPHFTHWNYLPMTKHVTTNPTAMQQFLIATCPQRSRSLTVMQQFLIATCSQKSRSLTAMHQFLIATCPQKSRSLTAGVNIFNGRPPDDELFFAEDVDLEELSVVVDEGLSYARRGGVLQAIFIEYNWHL